MMIQPNKLLGGLAQQLHIVGHWLLPEPSSADTQLDMELRDSTRYRNLPIPHQVYHHDLHHCLSSHCEGGVGFHIFCKSGKMKVEGQMDMERKFVNDILEMDMIQDQN